MLEFAAYPKACYCPPLRIDKHQWEGYPHHELWNSIILAGLYDWTWIGPMS